MTYKTILVHLHDMRRAHRLLEATIPLARLMNSHVIGLSILPPFIVVPMSDMGSASVTIDEHRLTYQAEMKSLKETFLDTVKGQPVPNEWRESDAGFTTAADILIEHGRATDLIILSQQDPDWSYSQMLEQPERVAIEAGRPILLVPNKTPAGGNLEMPPRRVTIAWNGRRESARAVFDAMPFLVKADEVQVLWINPDRDRAAVGDLPTADVSASLARHGIKCQVSQSSATSADVGAELMRQASAFGSGLLVMGCYGHSRLHEFILGGASRQVLQGMTMPILMSH